MVGRRTTVSFKRRKTDENVYIPTLFKNIHVLFFVFFFQLKSERITINYSMVPLISKRYINFIKYRVLFAKEVEHENTHVLIMI